MGSSATPLIVVAIPPPRTVHLVTANGVVVTFHLAMSVGVVITGLVAALLELTTPHTPSREHGAEPPEQDDKQGRIPPDPYGGLPAHFIDALRHAGLDVGEGFPVIDTDVLPFPECAFIA